MSFKEYASKEFVKEYLNDMIISEITDAIAFSAEMGLVSPTVADDGAIYTDENGVVYTL